MLLDDGLADRQSHPQATRLGRIERLEQARHPGQELPAPAVETPVLDPLGFGDDEPDAAGDKRTMDQARALGTARTVYAIDAGAGHSNDLQLDF